MRLWVWPSSATMVASLAVVWIGVGGVSLLVWSRARYCEKQPACAAPSSSSGLVPLPSAKRDALVKLPSRPVAVDIVPEPSSIVPSQRAVEVAAMSHSFAGVRTDRADLAHVSPYVADRPTRGVEAQRGGSTSS